MGKGPDFLAKALVPGGNVAESTILSAKSGDLTGLFRGGRLGEARGGRSRPLGRRVLHRI